MVRIGVLELLDSLSYGDTVHVSDSIAETGGLLKLAARLMLLFSDNKW